jgi:flagellar motor switch protein FliN/FliY
MSEPEAALETPAGQAVSGESLRDLPLHFWAELGRARIPLAQAVALPPGSVLELDRGVDDPVDLYVNGRHCGLGRLVLTDEGEWAIEILEVAGSDTAPVQSGELAEEPAA